MKQKQDFGSFRFSEPHLRSMLLEKAKFNPLVYTCSTKVKTLSNSGIQSNFEVKAVCRESLSAHSCKYCKQTLSIGQMFRNALWLFPRLTFDLEKPRGKWLM